MRERSWMGRAPQGSMPLGRPQRTFASRRGQRKAPLPKIKHDITRNFGHGLYSRIGLQQGASNLAIRKAVKVARRELREAGEKASKSKNSQVRSGHTQHKQRVEEAIRVLTDLDLRNEYDQKNKFIKGSTARKRKWLASQPKAERRLVVAVSIGRRRLTRQRKRGLPDADSSELWKRQRRKVSTKVPNVRNKAFPANSVIEVFERTRRERRLDKRKGRHVAVPGKRRL